jgi:hypothetical protein
MAANNFATLINSIPNNINLLTKPNFYFVLSNLPQVTYFLQRVNLPSITLPATSGQPSPFALGQVSGTKALFGDLAFEFKLDEAMLNYMELFGWIKSLGVITAFQTTPTITAANVVDGTLLIADQQKNFLSAVTYVNIIPTGLGDVKFDTTDTTGGSITAEASFRYDYFFIQSLTKQTT